MSANRQTKISLIETGDSASKIITSNVNYQQKSYQLLKKHIEGCLRTKPTDPAYDIETMSFKDKDSKEQIVITPENFEEMKTLIFEQTTIYMKTKALVRPSSPLKGRPRRDSQNDENNAPNNSITSPSIVRRAGSAPRRGVSSPVPKNNNKITTALPSSPSTPSSTTPGRSTTPSSSLRSVLRSSSAQRAGGRPVSPLRTSSPLLRTSAVSSSSASSISRHKSPANTRRARVNSVTTPSKVTTPGPTIAANENNLRLLSRSSIKKINRSSPLKENKENKNMEEGQEVEKSVDDAISTEDINVGLKDMSLAPVAQTDTAFETDNAPGHQIMDEDASPVAAHKDTWKEVYTPRNSHTVDEDDDIDADKSIGDVARNIFADIASPPKASEPTPSTTVSTTPGPNSTPVSSGLRRSSVKEATPRFNAKEKVHQAAVEAKAHKTGSRPTFMKATQSSKNHLNKESKEKIPDTKWEDGLRKSDNISRKVQSAMKDRHNAFMMKAIRSDTKTLQPDGRPSLNTMTAQWEFMRDQFVGSNDENLEWLMQAKKGGAPAYQHAKRKHQIAEDQYFKSLFEIDVMEAKLKILAGPGSMFVDIIKTIAQCNDILSMTPTDPEKKAIVQQQQPLLKSYFQEELKGVCCQNLQKDIQAIFEFSDESKAAKKARHVINNSYPNELTEIKDRLKKSNQAKEESLTEMEKWDTRLKETSEYAVVLAKKEVQWMEEFGEGNLVCLRQMRSLIPVNIAQLSIAELLKEVKNKGALYTQELAVEIKNNKLLHWLLMAPEDIAMTNFLSGEHRQYFVNLDGLDVVEMRALRMVLPDKFELDQDGQKAEWRERFIGRMKQLVAQQNEDFIKGGWDAECGKRSMVQLPELKPEQRRRPIYFFRTHEQMVKKLGQYADKAALLEKKQALLDKATAELKTCTDEYNYILEDSRDPYLRSEMGVEQLNAAKAQVKNELTAIKSKTNYLQSDVKRLQKSIGEMSVSQEDYAAMITEQGEYLNSIAPPPTTEDEKPFDFFEATESVQITGAFEECPEIKRIERSSAKFQSAEEEARCRKLELSQVKMSESAPLSDDSSADGTQKEEFQSFAVDKSMFEKSGRDSGDSAEGHMATPQRPRRGSVLLSANKNVIDTLNNMFSPSSLRRGSDATSVSAMSSSSTMNRNSIFSPTGPRGARRDSSISVGSDGSSVALEKKAARSKTLKKLMERKDSGVAEEAPKRPPNPFMAAMGGGGGMSFLDQIKAKRQKQEDNAA